MTRGENIESGALTAAACAGTLAFALGWYFVAVGIMATIAASWSLVTLARCGRRTQTDRAARNRQLRERHRQIDARASEAAAIDDVAAFRALMRATGAGDLDDRT